MTAPAAPAADHLTLDASAAFRADEAAQRMPRPVADPGDGRAVAPNDVLAPASGVWLLLVTSLERGTQLDARHRPGHFRRARVLWEEATAELGEPRYAQVGERLGRWRASDPTLPLVKELLWAFEQPEAAGYTRLALAGYAALARLVPADDARHGYILAQSARALRTLGDIEGARERYATSERLGVRHRDSWLRVRSALGLGATHHHAGNHQAAREIYRALLAKRLPDERFTAAAHHGMVLGAIAAEDWDTALAHGWHLLKAGRYGIVPRVDALLLMAAVCRRTGRYRAALNAAEAALNYAMLPEDPLLAHKVMADVALDVGDRERGLEHGAALRTLIHTGASPFEDAKALFTLGLIEERWGSHQRALADTGHAYDLACAHGYHELVFKLEAAQHRLRTTPSVASRGTGRRGDRPSATAVEVALSSQSQRIVAHLLSLDVGDTGLVAAGG